MFSPGQQQPSQVSFVSFLRADKEPLPDTQLLVPSVLLEPEQPSLEQPVLEDILPQQSEEVPSSLALVSESTMGIVQVEQR